MSAGTSAMIAALFGPAIFGCYAAARASSAVLQQSAVALVAAAWFMAEMNRRMEFEVVFSGSTIKHANATLHNAVSKAIRASCADPASNTIFEVQLAKDISSASQGPQEQPAPLVADQVTAEFADTAAHNPTAQSVDRSLSDKVHKQLPASRAEQGPAPGVAQAKVDSDESDLKPASAHSVNSSPAPNAASMRAEQADPALELPEEEQAGQKLEGGWTADLLDKARCRARQTKAALEEQQSKTTAILQAGMGMKVSKSRAEAAQQALVKEQAQSAKAEKFISDRAGAASRDTRAAPAKEVQAGAAVMKLQSAKAVAEEAAQAAAQRAELAEAAVRRYEKLHLRAASLQRALRKRPALQQEGECHCCCALPRQALLYLSCSAPSCPVWLCPARRCRVLLQTATIYIS